MKPVVIVCLFDLACAHGAKSLCANLLAHGEEAHLVHFGMPSIYRSAKSVRLLQCRGFLNTTQIDPPPAEHYAECIALLRRLDPLLVGISLDSRMAPFARELTELVRRELPGVPMVWGGIHAIIDPEHCLRFVDTVCMGEGEMAIVEMTRRLRAGNRDFRGIENLMGIAPDGSAYTGERRLLRDLNSVPAPVLPAGNVSWVPEGAHCQMLAKPRHHGGGFFRAYSTLASRGCLFHCSYCYPDAVRAKFPEAKQGFVRRRGMDHLFEELQHAKSLDWPEFIWFWDDIFGSDLRWLEEFSDRYPREIGIPFSVHLSPTTTTQRVIDLLEHAGCQSVGIGMQTGSARVHREVYCRLFDRGAVLRLAEILHPSFPTYYDIITDNPYETEDDVRETLSLFAEFPRPFWVASNSLIWFPGQTLTARALRDGVISDRDVVGHTTEGPYLYGDVTHRPQADTTAGRRLYSLNLLVAATQHAGIERGQLLEWSRDDGLLERPEELERRLLLDYLIESEADVLQLQEDVVRRDVEIAGLRVEVERLRAPVSPRWRRLLGV